MNILLIFFAIPFVVIVISIALQKILKCPILVAAIIFSIILLIAIIISNTILIIASVFYGILSFVTAVITCIICRLISNNNGCMRVCPNSNTINITGSLNQSPATTLDNQNVSVASNNSRRNILWML